MPGIMKNSPLGLPPPPDGELNVGGEWLTPEDASQSHAAIIRFLAYCRVPLKRGCPLARWLDALADAQQQRRDWREAFSLDAPVNHRKAYDLIEARRLAWSLRVLLAPGRSEPFFDASFVTKQLMGEDNREPDKGLRMPLGTGSLFLAARLQQVAPGFLHFFGNQSAGVDVEYLADPQHNRGRVFIEQKERAYFKSRVRHPQSLVEDIRSKITAGARGLAIATQGTPAGRVVLIGVSPDIANVDGVLAQVRENLGTWCGEILRGAKGDRSSIPHAVMLLAAAHQLDPDAMQSALRGGLVTVNPIGSDPSDEEWRVALGIFKKAGGD